jgi:hypothetical protein
VAGEPCAADAYPCARCRASHACLGRHEVIAEIGWCALSNVGFEELADNAARLCTGVFGAELTDTYGVRSSIGAVIGGAALEDCHRLSDLFARLDDSGWGDVLWYKGSGRDGQLRARARLRGAGRRTPAPDTLNVPRPPTYRSS